MAGDLQASADAAERLAAICLQDSLRDAPVYSNPLAAEGQKSDTSLKIPPRSGSSQSQISRQVAPEDSDNCLSSSLPAWQPARSNTAENSKRVSEEGSGGSRLSQGKNAPRVSIHGLPVFVNMERKYSHDSVGAEGTNTGSPQSWIQHAVQSVMGPSLMSPSPSANVTPTSSCRGCDSQRRRGSDKWHRIDVSQFTDNQGDEQIASLLSFAGCEVLLRATPLATVASNFGRLFRNAKGSAATYQLSEVSETIDAFVSHNWSVPRHIKFAVLAYHFNLLPAGIASFILLLFLGIAGLFQCVPTIQNKALGAEMGFLCQLCLIPAAFLVMLLWWDVIRHLGVRGPLLFVDKSCIHQTDMEVQRQAISKLGAFIGVSKQMIAIFGDEYLSKLWTVYEVASFLSLHPTQDLKICPTTLPKLALCLVATAWLVQVMSTVINMFVLIPRADKICLGIGMFLLGYLLRETSKSKEAIKGTIAQFSVKNCLCTNEADRPVIYQNIALLMRKTLRWSDDVPQEELLAAFEQEVREEFPDALRQQMGNLVIPYHHTLILSALTELPYLVDAMPLMHTMELRFGCVFVATHLAWAFALLPTILLTLQVMAALNIHLRGLHEAMWCLGSTAGVVLVFALLNVIDAWAEESDAGLTALAILVVCTSLLNRGILHSDRGTKPVKPATLGHGRPMRASASKRRGDRRPYKMSPKSSELSGISTTVGHTYSADLDFDFAVNPDYSYDFDFGTNKSGPEFSDDALETVVNWV